VSRKARQPRSTKAASSARPRKGTIKFTEAVRARYLEHLAKTGNKQAAADHVAIDRGTPEDAAKKEPAFAEERDAALARYAATIEAEIHRRAIEGVLEPVYQKGARVMEPVLDENGGRVTDANGNELWRPASIVKYSDQLLLAKAKAHIPSYRDKAAAEVNVTGGVLVVGSGGESADDWAAKHGGGDGK
jgi:hypothetical protein